MTSQKPLRRLPLAAAVCAALLFSLPACAQTAAVTPAAAAANAPAKVEKNADTGIARITLTERAVERLELKTETVTAGDNGTVRFPYGALLYDGSGKTWVYTSTATHTFERRAVSVSRIEAGTVVASDGPAPGTSVVTVGAAELFGAEFSAGK